MDHIESRGLSAVERCLIAASLLLAFGGMQRVEAHTARVQAEGLKVEETKGLLESVWPSKMEVLEQIQGVETDILFLAQNEAKGGRQQSKIAASDAEIDELFAFYAREAAVGIIVGRCFQLFTEFPSPSIFSGGLASLDECRRAVTAGEFPVHMARVLPIVQGCLEEQRDGLRADRMNQLNQDAWKKCIDRTGFAMKPALGLPSDSSMEKFIP